MKWKSASNPHVCRSVTELIRASADHLSDRQSDSNVALLNRRAKSGQGAGSVDSSMLGKAHRPLHLPLAYSYAIVITVPVLLTVPAP